MSGQHGVRAECCISMSAAGPGATGRRGASDLLSVGGQSSDLANIQDKYDALELSQSISTYEQNEFIPDEILQVLTSTAKAAENPGLGPASKTKTGKDTKVFVRTADQVWHHPLRRNKFKHLTDQPVCLTGAGRDISFLCDVLLKEKKNTAITPLKPIDRSDMAPGRTEGGIEESLIPKEFYIVKNKGVLGLEYYEDKYTTLLEDEEKKLRLFPSMKPSGRAEVLQLMKVMDNMLKTAGVDEEDLKLEGPTQIHNLLELIKTEQNIYNIVFHELIRQVSTECVERGVLLAKLRERYVMLLNKIPQQVLSLYNDLLAQRALDRSLTEQIIYFKNSIGELTDELYQVREHDRRVSKEAKQTQTELAKALRNAKKNANLLEEYRELYELQRSRLEKQLAHLTEERDLWSSATYRVARKVIEENQLQLARRLYISEKAWTKVVRHFIVLLASNDTRDLSEIQQSTEKWREHMARFELEVQRSEESGREKIQTICTDLKKWLLYFQENVFVDWHYQAVPEDVAVRLLQDLQNWKNMLSEEQQQFKGHKVVNNQESLKAAADIQKQWSHIGEKVLKRHEGLDGSPAPELKAMEDLNSMTELLCEQYRRRVQGENGVARGLTAISNSLEHWSLPLHAHKYAPNETKESDWSSLFHLLPEWIAQAEQVLELIGSPDSEERPSLDSIKKVETEEVFKTLQQWVLTITSGTERDNVQLTQEVTNLHTSMVQYLVDILILLSPDYSSDSDPSDTNVVVGFDNEEFAATVPLQKMQEEALALSEKLNLFSSYITRSCQDMMENNPLDEDSGYELRQLQAIRSSCDEWTETCKLLLSKVRDSAVPSEIRPQDPFISGNKANTQLRMDKLMNNMVPTQDTMRIIGYDGNIYKKSLLEVEIPISTESALKASRPSTPRSIQAFESLTSLQQLENRLLHSEMRAQKAEERAENLDEQLKAALQRVQELELKSQSEDSTMKEETPIPIEATSEKLSLPVSAKKRPKSSKTKQHK